MVPSLLVFGKNEAFLIPQEGGQRESGSDKEDFNLCEIGRDLKLVSVREEPGRMVLARYIMDSQWTVT